MNKDRITGIIDIGSNTVRLSVYQLTEDGAYRVIDQGRWAARLSQKLNDQGALTEAAIDELAEVLRHYRRICQLHGASRIRAVATAAVRQATNHERIIERLSEETGILVEILSGEDEARYGSQAMLSTLGFSDGFVIDIGGGSTEISLLLGRKVAHAVSFPFGCVNTGLKFALGAEAVPSSVLSGIQQFVDEQLSAHPWIGNHQGLPLIGLGGTVRALAKLHQRQTDYPLQVLHGYELREADIAQRLDQLAAVPLDRRKKLPGLSKDRGDVIVPGLAILLGIVRHTAASEVVVCNAGLRDGLFYDTCLPAYKPLSAEAVLQESIRNLQALYPVAPKAYLNQVSKLALAMHDWLADLYPLPGESRRLLETASQLFRIGTTIDFNNSAEHTFYMLLHTHWNGMTHREIVLTAAIAAFTSYTQVKRNLGPYRSILNPGDIILASRLGSLLQLAAALDRSESQAISSINLAVIDSRFQIYARAPYPIPVEQMETAGIAKVFKKAWGLTPKLIVTVEYRV